MYDAAVRTLIPYLVGLLVTWAATAGLDLPVSETTAVVTVIVGWLYYIISHWIERNVSSGLGRILISAGLSKKTPAYSASPPRE